MLRPRGYAWRSHFFLILPFLRLIGYAGHSYIFPDSGNFWSFRQVLTYFGVRTIMWTILGEHNLRLRVVNLWRGYEIGALLFPTHILVIPNAIWNLGPVIFLLFVWTNHLIKRFRLIHPPISWIRF